METQFDIASIQTQVRLIREAAEKLHGLGDGFPALSKNAARILASVKMVEINVSDPGETMEI